MVRTSSVSLSRNHRAFLMFDTRAEGSIGKVTIEISQRSASRMRRTPLLASVFALTVWKPIDSPSSAPALHQLVHLAGARHAAATAAPRHKARGHPRGSSSRRRSVRPDHAGTACAHQPRRARQAIAESPGLDRVLAEIDLAEDAGIAGKTSRPRFTPASVRLANFCVRADRQACPNRAIRSWVNAPDMPKEKGGRRSDRRESLSALPGAVPFRHPRQPHRAPTRPTGSPPPIPIA